MSELPLQNINPQVRTVEIGKRNLRKVSLYPLAVGDQLKMNNFLAEVFTMFVQMDPSKPMSAAFIAAILGKISENLDVFCQMVFEQDGILNEMTNNQAVEVVKVVYEQNYEVLAKNVQSLFKNKNLDKVLDSLGLERQSSASAATTPDTPSTPSSESASPKEG
jgi:hypothetical protein